MAVVQTQEHFWHREHLQTPCFQVSWGDTTKSCRPPGFRGFWCAHRCSQWDHTAIRAQLNHSMVFVRDRDRRQAANKVLFPLQPFLQAWQAAEERLLPCTAGSGMVFGSEVSKAMQCCTRHQPPTFQRDAELPARWEWEKGLSFLISYFIILLKYCG